MDALTAATATAAAVTQLGSHFMVAGATYQRGAALGFGGLDFYVTGRGGVLGDVARQADAAAFARALQQRGLSTSRSLGFNNTYALAMTQERATRLGINRISDLVAHPGLRFGLTQEFIGRADGWRGLRAHYSLPFDTPRGVDHGLKFGAVTAGQLDVIDVYSTDAAIERHRLRVLVDDRAYFPRYDAVLLYRTGLEQRLPRTHAALVALQGRLDDATMRKLNARAEIGGERFGAIAAAFVAGTGPGDLPSGSSQQAVTDAASAQPPAGAAMRRLWHALFDADFLRLSSEHLVLVFASLVL